jgi:hypothetical protein
MANVQKWGWRMTLGLTIPILAIVFLGVLGILLSGIYVFLLAWYWHGRDVLDAKKAGTPEESRNAATEKTE